MVIGSDHEVPPGIVELSRASLYVPALTNTVSPGLRTLTPLLTVLNGLARVPALESLPVVAT